MMKLPLTSAVFQIVSLVSVMISTDYVFVLRPF